jgi:methylmalonyl-CoA mutase
VIQEETGMTKVVDPLGGSYYVEALTSQLVDKAQEIIDRVATEGGMAQAVAAGWPKAMIEEASAAKQARVDRGEDVIVGVNKYKPAQEDDIEILAIDNHAVREGQIARLKRIRETRDEAACMAALGALREAAANPPRYGEGDQPQAGGGGAPQGQSDEEAPLRQPSADTSPSRGGSNLLALAVVAARARATLGEISAAMEAGFGRHETVPTPVKGIYAGAFDSDARWTRLQDGVAATERRMGRRPRMLVAKMGQDGHDRGANLVSSMFGDLGFEIVPGPLFQTPEEAARLAIARDVDVVGASSLAAGHLTLIPELIGHLKDADRADIKVIAGGVIPQQDYQALRDAGVQAIFGPGTNLIAAAEEVLRLLGHNMAPETEETA